MTNIGIEIAITTSFQAEWDVDINTMSIHHRQYTTPQNEKWLKQLIRKSTKRLV